MTRKFLALLLSLLLNGALFALLSAFVYRQRLQLGIRFFPYTSDEFALFGTLWMMLGLCALPGLALAALALWRGYDRLALWLNGSWAFLVNIYLLADTAALSISGSHLLYFLGYVSDILMHPELEGLAWVGGTRGLIAPSLAILIGSAIACLLSHYLATTILTRTTALGYLVGTITVLLTFILSSPWWWSDLLISTAVYQQLPIPTQTLQRVSTRRFSHGLKIVELTNSLTSDDTVVIRNFGPPVQLQGWQVRTRNSQFPLDGILDTNQEIAFSADFAHDVEWLTLLDPQGRPQDALQYTTTTQEWLASLPYHRGAFEALAPAVDRLQEALDRGVKTPAPPDPGPQVTNKKHVVIILLESFRRDAVSPESTPQLSRWSQHGVEMKQHVSGANGTHLSLYSLLFGRCATYYRRDLNAWIEPQMMATFKASGYQTSYYSSATSVGWMWMERMLAPRYFDRIELGQEHRSVDQWHRWNSKDADYIAEIPELLTSATQPQLVVMFAMSTHYPYPFPKEFDLHQPSLGDSLHSQQFAHASQEILKNRYANSVAYLDALIGSFLSRVDLDNTIVVITGDHGEGLWDDGSAAHGTRLSEVQLAVPCLVLGGGLSPTKIDYPTYHGDILPTLLHALEGRPTPIQGGHGISVLAPTERDSVPVVPTVAYPPYGLALFAGEDRLKFSISTSEWFSGRIGLGFLTPGLHVTFAGQLAANGLIRGGTVDRFDFPTWNRRLDYWAELLSR